MNIPDDLYERIKEIAKTNKTNVAAIINELLESYTGIDRVTELERRVSELEKKIKEISKK